MQKGWPRFSALNDTNRSIRSDPARFAAALAAFEVDNAIYLVGSDSSYGWYIPKEEEIVEFGINVHRRSYRNESYIRWRKAE